MFPGPGVSPKGRKGLVRSKGELSVKAASGRNEAALLTDRSAFLNAKALANGVSGKGTVKIPCSHRLDTDEARPGPCTVVRSTLTGSPSVSTIRPPLNVTLTESGKTTSPCATY